VSWSLHAEGTKSGAKRTLNGQKIWGTALAEEQACFDKTREALIGFIDSVEEAQSTEHATIVTASASGHGTQVSNVTFTTRVVAVG
jgi:hypothetical protein